MSDTGLIPFFQFYNTKTLKPIKKEEFIAFIIKLAEFTDALFLTRHNDEELTKAVVSELDFCTRKHFKGMESYFDEVEAVNPMSLICLNSMDGMYMENG